MASIRQLISSAMGEAGDYIGDLYSRRDEVGGDVGGGVEDVFEAFLERLRRKRQRAAEELEMESETPPVRKLMPSTPRRGFNRYYSEY